MCGVWSLLISANTNTILANLNLTPKHYQEYCSESATAALCNTPRAALLKAGGCCVVCLCFALQCRVCEGVCVCVLDKGY